MHTCSAFRVGIRSTRKINHDCSYDLLRSKLFQLTILKHITPQVLSITPCILIYPFFCPSTTMAGFMSVYSESIVCTLSKENSMLIWSNKLFFSLIAKYTDCFVIYSAILLQSLVVTRLVYLSFLRVTNYTLAWFIFCYYPNGMSEERFVYFFFLLLVSSLWHFSEVTCVSLAVFKEGLSSLLYREGYLRTYCIKTVLQVFDFFWKSGFQFIVFNSVSQGYN